MVFFDIFFALFMISNKYKMLEGGMTLDLTVLLLIVSFILFICIYFKKILGKTGIPGLFIFIVLGMLCGIVFNVEFEFSLANDLCSVALIFIIFYGGVGTKWSKAKPVAIKAISLSSIGTILTAFFVGMFGYFVLNISLLESLLIASVICSTDAASVFSILRSKKMNLKYNTASLVEVESGSNDPFSYMLTTIILTIMLGGKSSFPSIILLLFLQIFFGVIFGFLFAFLAKFVLKKFKINESGFDLAFLVAVAVISYALTTLLKGNGYLAVYITGIVIGNSNILTKKNAFHFFDGLTSIIQMLMFFLIGLISTPQNLIKPEVFVIAVLIALFLTFIGRPLAVFICLTFFKAKPKQQLFVAWTGMRGVASIVFSIIAIAQINEKNYVLQYDLFHIVFFIVLFSILLQGTLLPIVAKLFNMIDYDDDVMKTFNDYLEEVPVNFLQFKLPQNHAWCDKRIFEIILPPESILVLILRGNKKIIPKGNTRLHENDIMIMSGIDSSCVEGINIYEKVIDESSELANKKIKDLVDSSILIILIKRKDMVIIPRGDTLIKTGDILVINVTK